MSAQEATTAVQSTRSDEERAICQEQQLPNGVTQQGEHAASSGVENPNQGDLPRPTRTTAADFLAATMPVDTGPEMAEPPYDMAPDWDARDTHGRSSRPFPTPPPQAVTPPSGSTVRVQEFYSAASRGNGEQSGIRWVTRLTEFLRTTANRSASNVDRMLDHLGIPALSPPTTSYSLPGRVIGARNVNFSPPEELPNQPPGALVPAMPSSWAASGQQQALFTEDQIAMMRQSQREHPQLYGPASEGESDRSSRLQAEVQRQMEEYMQKHRGEVTRLQREVQTLRDEKQQLLQGVPPGNLQQLPHGGHPTVPQGSGVPPGNLQQLPHGGHPTVPQGSGVPPGNPQQLPHGGHPTVPQGSGVPPGNSQQLPHGGHPTVPQGSGVPPGNSQQLPHGGHPTVPQGSGVPPGNPQQLPHGGHPTVPQGSGVPPGNPQQLPHDPLSTSQGQDLPQATSTKGEHGDSELPRVSTSAATGSSTTPQQWLGTQPSPDPMALLAGSMAQIQAVMLKQMNAAEKVKESGEASPETVKPGTTTLPQLPAMRAESASVDIMDWLEMLRAPMSDLSDGSGLWWDRVKEAATKSYVEWAKASPIERLTVSPPRVEELETGKWSRVNSRASSMLMLALADGVRSEMVARRLTGSATSILFRLMTLYQPGGEEEKVRILRNLQEPPQEGDPQKVLEALRSWERWLRRCKELGVTAPDPALLSRGLNSMSKRLMEKYPDASFRTSLVKSTLMVDTRPTLDSVDAYYRHLLAECETLAVAASSPTTTTPANSGKPEPKIKPMKPEPTSTTTTITPPSAPPRSPSQNTSGNDESDKEKRANTPCRYFGKTYKGCARGTKCPFQHTWEGNEKEKAQRCWTCGGKHLTKQCPTTKHPQQSSQTPAPNAKASPTTPRTNPTPSSSATSGTTTKSVRIDENPEVEPIQPRAQGASGSTGGENPDLKEMLADVGKMLKQMTAANLKRATVMESGFEQKLENIEAKMKALSVECEEGPLGGLLDSGASHAMRMAQGSEYEEGSAVKVTLAGEDVREMRQNLHGTVLIEDNGTNEVQPIVPLGAMIEELNCSLQWKKGEFQLRHPTRGLMKVKLVNNCPEIKAKDALSLIKELETKHMMTLCNQVSSLKARLEVLRKEETRSWDELLKEFVASGSQSLILRMVLTCSYTRDLPEDVQAMVSEGFNVAKGLDYLKRLPVTRRKRKLLLTSNNWVVCLNQAGGEGPDEPFSVVSKKGKVVLEVDTTKSKLWDINRREGVYQLLLWAAAAGKITDILGSPAHSTWPTSLKPDRGPESYPTRTTAFPFGHDELPPMKLKGIHNETAAMVKQMILWMVATVAGKGNVGFLMEQPSPKEYLRKDDPTCASIWNTELWKSFKSISGIGKVSFYMGALGHKAKRPTTIATNYARLCQLDDLYDFSENCVPRSLVEDKEMNTWSQGFKKIVAKAVCEFHEGTYSSERELADLGVKLSKLTKEQKEAWQRHLMNDHQPYRADCSVCINAQATGYQHRRRAHPSLYTMAIDLAGPFKQRGRDMEHEDYKYLMVAAYRCPREYMSAKAISEVGAELYVPDEPDDEDGLFDCEEELLPGGEDEGKKESSAEEDPVPLGPETLEEAVEDLMASEEVATVYITRPLRRRTAAHVLQATKEMALQLRQTGLHLTGIHSDRAREFKARPFREWTSEANLRHTKTAGGDPAGNSTAEIGIKWAKSRMRALLKGSGAPPGEWPMAAAHASSSLWARAFPDSPWFHPPVTTFGSEVWFRAKNYKGAKEKKHEAAGTRWKKGWYRGPAMDVNRGHLIARDDGGLTIAKGVKYNVVDIHKDPEIRDLLQPGIAEGVLEEAPESELVAKTQLQEEVEFQARMALEEGKFTIEEVLDLYNKLEKLGDSDRRLKGKTEVKSWYTGAFVYGGKAGPRNNVENYPYTTKFLVKFAKEFAPERGFSAIGITRNAQLGIHRDVHNYRNSLNHVMPLTNFKDGDIWVQNDEVQEDKSVKKILPTGKEVKGEIKELQRGRVTSFSPRLWHEVQPWEGDRVMMLLFTPRATRLSEDGANKLREAGFVIDPKSMTTEVTDSSSDEEELKMNPEIRVLRSCDGEGMKFLFEEVQEEDLLPGGDPQLCFQDPDLQGDGGEGLRCPRVKRILKKAEVQYTPDIEEVLHDLMEKKQTLQVTHTVSLQDVKKNLDAWKPSAWKEFQNLTKGKDALEVTKRHLLPPGCRIVPCKGVYTVKPDKGEPGFRRKTRFVACGNHVPEGESTFDLFAAGLDATSLRTMLAFTAEKKQWRWGVTDIRQAFVLAKWLGGPVALQPPTIAHQLGLAEEGDVWLVRQAIYGLRESPAMWSQFRDSQLKQARWIVEAEGGPVVMKLEQLITDDQVWKIVREDGQGEPHGYLLVYIDDMLVNAEETTMWGFFKWLSAKWEVDELDVLDYEHPIKFLGTELHRVPGGVEIGQEGFINELLRSYNHNGARSKVQGPKETLILTDEEERALIDAQPIDNAGKEEEIKEAQRRVGELLWLTGRSRPDIQYTVSIMSSRITRCPELVNKVGERLLDYLCETANYRLSFFSHHEEKKFDLDVYTDSSFAPSGGRSQGSCAVFYNDCAIAWRSARQQLCTLSTAESELLEAVEGTVLGRATKGLIDELTGRNLRMNLLVDNAAAVSLLAS